MIERYKPRRNVEPYLPCVLDIETDTTGDVLAVGFAYSDDDGRHYSAYTSWEQWFSVYLELLLETKKTKRGRFLRIYAHNGSNFDWLSFLHWLEQYNAIAGLRIITSESSAIGLDFKIILDTGELNIKLRDSLKLIPVSLKQAAKTFQTEHQKLDLDDVLPGKLLKDDPVRFWQYLENDTLALQEVVYTFWSNIVLEAGNVGELPMTQASLALRLWKMQLDYKVWTPWNPRLKALERRSYRGGRVEAFDIGTFLVNIYDANSEYPTVMQSQLYPCSDRGAWTDRYTGQHGIYEIEYNQPDQTIPPILCDETTNDFQYSGRGVYAMPEIEFLLSRGGTIKTIQGYVFQDVAPIFKTFIDQWWSVRQKAQAVNDDGMSYAAKILMNSLYGKFGQRETGWVVRQVTADQEKEMIQRGDNLRYVGPYVMVEEPVRSHHTFVSIASYVTAYGRLHLYQQIENTIRQGGTVVYCDTDSVHTTGVELETGSGLGQWKHEHNGEVTYLGKKLYMFSSGKIKAKGIGRIEQRTKATGTDGQPVYSTLGYNDFKRMANNPNAYTVVEYKTFPTWRETVGDLYEPCKLVTRQRTLRQTKKT